MSNNTFDNDPILYAGRATGHVQNVGDVEGELGDWIGRIGSRHWMEAFSLTPPDAIPPEELEYQAAFSPTWLSPWYSAGRLCGCRGFNLPLYGLAVRLRGRAAEHYDLHYSVRFVDGICRDIADQTLCVAPSAAPLEAFRIVLTRRANSPAESVSAHRTYVSKTVASLTTKHSLRKLRNTPFSRVVLAPAGAINMPPCRVLNPPNRQQPPSLLGESNDGLLAWGGDADEIFPRRVDYPEAWVARLEHAQVWPFAPPFLPAGRVLINDFLVPWGQHAVGWFKQESEGAYRFPYRMKDERWVDTGFYMGHPISGHFGHFIGDCLCRMHAWNLCKRLFGDVKVLLEYAAEDTGFRASLLRAAGVPAEDIVFVREPTYCRTLLVASPALSVQRYVSPSAALLWRQIRDGFGETQVGWAKRLYLSRSGQPVRKLVNEVEVERLFARYGFQVVRPEEFSIEEQVAMISHAELIAGTGGSAMFGLAFQKRLRSVMWIVPERFVQITEWFFLAGTECPAYYHLGSGDLAGRTLSDPHDVWGVDLSHLDADVVTWLASVS